MLAKTILLLLGAVLLLQSSNARYHDMDSAVSALEERLKLLKCSETELKDLKDALLEKGRAMYEKVVKDPKVLAIESDLMKSNLEAIRKFLENYEGFKKKVLTEDLSALEFKKIMTKLNDEGNGEVVEHDAILTSAKENGLLEMREIIQERIKISTEKLCAEIQKYTEGLNEAQKKDESELLDVLEKCKNETDQLKRADMFYSLLENIDIENFLW